MKELSVINSYECVAPSALRELRELADSSDDPGQFGELIDLFLRELESGLASMRNALAQGDAKELAKLAHSLKGAAASMGAGRLASFCLTLEEMTRNSELERAEAELRQIESEGERVREMLEAEASR